MDDSQTNAGAFKLAGRMEPLKHAKERFSVLWIEPAPIVAEKEDCLQGSLFGADFDASFGPWAGVFQRVRNQIEQDLADRNRVSLDVRQGTNRPDNLPAFQAAT